MRKQFLNDGWILTEDSLNCKINARVPGCLHKDLENAGIIKDLFYRDNAKEYKWVEDLSAVYSISFDAEEYHKAVLKFDGLDTFCDIYLNGEHIGSTHNMFIQHGFDVSSVLKPRGNKLEVRFTSPIKAVEGMPMPRKYAFTPDRVRARRMQCTYGWDWVYRFVTMGIYRPVYIEYRDGLEIEDVYIRTDFLDNYGASLTAEMEFSGFDRPEIVKAEIFSPDNVCVFTDEFYADRANVRRHIDISAPELWYPSGYGEQPLYKFRLTSGNGTYETLFGIRTVRLLTLKDTPGSDCHSMALSASKTSIGSAHTSGEDFFGFAVIVNGVRIFARGANWVPCEPFPSEESDGKISKLLEMYRTMGANIIRVWGGGLLERDALYNACDKLGILVVHDFFMACAEYPEKEDWFINELRLESEYTVKHLRNHPSLAWFHGDNENAVDGSDISADYCGRSSAYNGIFPSVYKLAPNIPVLESSPWGGRTFSSICSGTSHNTNFLGDIFGYFDSDSCDCYKEYLSQFTSRFVSEEPTFGAVCRESLLEFLSEDDLCDENEEMLNFHTLNNPCLINTIYSSVRSFAEKVLGVFTDAEDRLFKYRYIQCEWQRLTMELAMRNIGYTSGIIYWMYNDCWPAALGWSFVDYYTREKAAYYSFKRSSIPVIGSFDPSGTCFTVSSSCTVPVSAAVRFTAVDNDGNTVVTKEETVTVSPYGKNTLSPCMAQGTKLVIADVESQAGKYRTFHKNGKLEIVRNDAFDITEINGSCITVRAKRHLQAVELSGALEFSDNYFSMISGEEKTVSFKNCADSKTSVSVISYTLK